MKGWYPDPGGRPGRYRWFDGETWSDATTDDPRARPPTTARTRSLRSALRSLAVIAVVTAVGLSLIWAAVRYVDRADRPSLLPPPAPATPTPYAIGAACTGGSPASRARHPTDGRVYGGNLSFAPAERFALAAAEERLTFAWDVQQQVNTVDAEPQWLAQVGVAELRGAAGFAGPPRAVAERALGCLLATKLYDPKTLTAGIVTSQSRTVSGRVGWAVTAEVRIALANLDFPGERVVIIVVPDEDRWGLFFSAVPLDDPDLLALADRAAEGLVAS